MSLASGLLRAPVFGEGRDLLGATPVSFWHPHQPPQTPPPHPPPHPPHPQLNSYISMYQLIAEEFSREDLVVKSRLRLGMVAGLVAGAACMCVLAVWS